MIEAALLTYGMILSFVLQSAHHNVKARRPHPPILRYFGYGLCGSLAGTAICLIATIPLGINIGV